MKNLFNFCLIAMLFALTVPTSTNAQCSRQFENAANLSLFYGSAETVGVGLTIIRSDVMYGIGYSHYIGGVNESVVLPNQSFFGTVGYQIGRLSVSGIGGVNDNTFYTDGTKNKTDMEAFYGGFVGYRVLDGLKLNVGYDTFNEVTIGISARL